MLSKIEQIFSQLKKLFVRYYDCDIERLNTLCDNLYGFYENLINNIIYEMYHGISYDIISQSAAEYGLGLSRDSGYYLAIDLKAMIKKLKALL